MVLSPAIAFLFYQLLVSGAWCAIGSQLAITNYHLPMRFNM
ncbi:MULTISPECIES: hypothetical protein [Chroococcidiopsis]|nr:MULTISPECIES: hypothetical protein [Chroococcidiopsis]